MCGGTTGQVLEEMSSGGDILMASTSVSLTEVRVPADAGEIGEWTEKKREQLRSKIEKNARKLEKLRKEYNKIPKKKLVIDVQTTSVVAAQAPSSN